MATTIRGDKPPANDAPLWGNTSANITKPITTLIDDGYATQAAPGSADWNWITNYLSAGVTHCFVYGIAEWDVLETYVTNSYTNRVGLIYRSRVGSNLGNTPESSPTQWHDIRLPLSFSLSAPGAHTPQALFNERVSVDTSGGAIAITLGVGLFIGQEISFENSDGATGNALSVTASGVQQQSVYAGDRKVFRWNGASYLQDKELSIEVVSAWVNDTTYSSEGTLVERYGRVYTSTNKTANINKDPVDPANVSYWFTEEGDIEALAKSGLTIKGGMHVISDRASAEYTTSILINKRKIGSKTYEFTKVNLDGSVVSGALATLLTGYPYLDKYAPGGSPLIDMGGRYERDQSSGADVVPTAGAVHDDAMQRIQGSVDSGAVHFSPSGAITLSGSNAGTSATSGPSGFTFDSANSITPNPAKTDDIETRVRSFVTGISSIIVMKEV